jgi:hypothetical protein
LRRPIDGGHHSVGCVVGIGEGQALAQDIMPRPVSVFEALGEQHLDHISISVVQHLLQKFGGLIEKITEIAALHNSLQLF